MAELTTVYRPQFFMHVLESPEPLTLPQLRTMVTETFIERNDERIAELNAERRAGRPKAKELVELEEIRRVESAEWETGFGESGVGAPVVCGALRVSTEGSARSGGASLSDSDAVCGETAEGRLAALEGEVS